MTDAEELIDYWKNGIKENLRSMVGLFSDFESFKLTYDVPDSIITEKPDVIPQQLWDDLFIKTQFSYNNFKRDESILFLEIDQTVIACFKHNPVIYFIVDTIPEIISDDSISIEPRIMDTYDDYIGYRFENGNFKPLVSAAIEYYGRENVIFGLPNYHPDTCHFILENRNSISIFIKHDPFWCSDSFGISYKITGGISRISLRDNGATEPDALQFAAYSRDKLWDKIIHPHCPSVRNISKITFKNVCTGAGSPINMAITSYCEDVNEDTAYGLILNYQNLLNNEDEEGTPYYYIRKNILEVVGEEGDVPAMGIDEVIEAIKIEHIEINAGVTSHSIEVEVPMDSIKAYIEQSYSGNSNKYIDSVDKKIYKKEIRRLYSNTGSKFGEFYFNSQLLTCEVLDHSPNRFDISGISEDHRRWSNVTLLPPKASGIKLLERKIESIVNLKLISNNDLRKIECKTPEELIGLSEIGRRTDIDSVV